MLRKILVALVVLGSVALGSQAQAQYCGGTLVQDNDCASNTDRSYSASCCPPGYRVQGVAYNDLQGSDYADAVSAVCRHVTKGNTMMPTDFQTQPVVHMCEKTEILLGIAYKDMPKGGKRSDILDGVTAICQNPTTKATRTLYSNDLAGNGRGYETRTISLPNRIVGIIYKDIGKGTDSDRADCVTVSYKYQPIVK